MVVATPCPICRKTVLPEDDPLAIAARMAGMRDDFPLVYFHYECYPGDEGSGFVQVERDDP